MGFGSGGGSNNISTSGDVALNSPANDDVLTFDAATSKWKNAAGGIIPDTSQYPVIVVHNGVAATARPNVSNVVLWYGTVEPTNMAEQDFWHVTGTGTTTPAQPGFVGPFDSLAVPFRAHSLRRLRSAYTGPAIKVRRSSDNTEQDISFTSDGQLDTSALTAFASGSDSAFVTTWYDQSGFARHFVQTTVAAQPRIVNNGVVDTRNSKPTLVLDGNDYLTSSTVGLYVAGSASVAMVSVVNASTNATVLAEVGASSTHSYRLARVGAGSTSSAWRASLTASNTVVWEQSASGDTTFDGTSHQLFVVDTGTTIAQWHDQIVGLAAAAAARGSAPTLVRTSLGAAGYDTPSGFTTSSFQEIVAWGTDMSTDRTTISANQKAFWSTP